MVGNQDDQNNKKGVAGKRIGMALGAGLAAFAAGPPNAQTAMDSDNLQLDTYSESNTYSDSSVFSASPEALAAVEASGNVSSSEQASAAVKAFLAQHPFIQGETITTKDGGSIGPSYEPLLDWRAALEAKASEMNPLTLGLLWQAIKKEEARVMEGGSE